MAKLLIEGETLRLSLKGCEQLGALHADIRIPLRHVAHAEVVENPWRFLRGIRAPGTALPGLIMIGTARIRGKKDFCAIYRGKPAVIVQLRDEAFDRFIVSSWEAQSFAERINGSAISA